MCRVAIVRSELPSVCATIRAVSPSALTRPNALFRIGSALEVAWLPDTSGLLVVAQATSGSPFQIWQLSYPSGQLSRVTNDLDAYTSISLTADSHRLFAVQNDLLSNLWVVTRGEGGSTQQITFGRGKREGYDGLGWLSDNRIAYSSLASGSPEAWAVDADGSNPKQLTQGTRLNPGRTKGLPLGPPFRSKNLPAAQLRPRRSMTSSRQLLSRSVKLTPI